MTTRKFSHCDYDWGKRMGQLVSLMESFPDQKMKKLQAEALELYPLESKAAVRHWFSARTAYIAAGHLNHKFNLMKEKI